MKSEDSTHSIWHFTTQVSHTSDQNTASETCMHVKAVVLPLQHENLQYQHLCEHCFYVMLQQSENMTLMTPLSHTWNSYIMAVTLDSFTGVSLHSGLFDFYLQEQKFSQLASHPAHRHPLRLSLHSLQNILKLC